MIELSKLNIPYTKCLYRKNNFNKPTFWYITPVHATHNLYVRYGVVGTWGTSTTIICSNNRDLKAELESKIKAKRKEGYKYLDEIKDNCSLPVEEGLYDYLVKYLPINRTSADNNLLPMLAKVYDPTNTKIFENSRLGQRKINGLRCFISAYKDNDLFATSHLRFQSREGTVWDSLKDLEQYLLTYVITHEFLTKMIEDNYILDGELYLPGYSVNEINHFVKDPTCKENKLLQYWCYDLAIENESQEGRITILNSYFGHRVTNFNSKEEHLAITNRFNLVKSVYVYGPNDALRFRDVYINQGFEGLILRDRTAEYQFGRRNQSMIKYKKSTDGVFKVIDIKPEGFKRSNIALLVCKNDINSAEFECHVNGSLDYQSQVLRDKDDYIGKSVYIEYGERSGVNKVPFHLTTVMFKNE